MAKIIVFGDMDISPLYVSVDNGKELRISGKYPRCINVSVGVHDIFATSASKFDRASMGRTGDFLSAASNAIASGTNSTIGGELEFSSNDVLLIEVKVKGVKTELYNKLVSETDAEKYVDMSSVLEFGEKAPGEKNKWVVLLLCLFFGWLGVHRFYEKKIITGVLYLITFGFCGIGVLIDLVSIFKR